MASDSSHAALLHRFWEKTVQQISPLTVNIVVEENTTAQKDLIARITSGETKAFAELVEAHQRLVFHIVTRLIRNQTDREDLAQDIFLKVYDNLSGFQFEAKLSTWIAKIAYNTTLNYLNKKKVPLYEDRESNNGTLDTRASLNKSPSDEIEQRDVSQCVKREIDELPAQFKIVITLYHLEQMSYAEIAEVTDLPDGTVKSYLFRARKLLKERLLSKYQPEELWQ